MAIPLSDDELSRLLRFVGYGRFDAPVWFLGMEEGGGGEENLRGRLEYDVVEDLAEAHWSRGVTRWHGEKPRIQSTWRTMCQLMLALDGQEPEREAVRRYQADLLGRHDGSTLLAELMPIPKPRLGAWGYEELIPQYASAADYYERVKPQRVELLRGLVSEHRPKTVVGYGRQFWPDYKMLFPAAVFEQSDRFEVADADGTRIVLCDHFTARTMNGRLGELVAAVRATS